MLDQNPTMKSSVTSKVICQTISGLSRSVVAFGAFMLIHFLLSWRADSSLLFGECKENVLFGNFLGPPIGSLVGFLAVHRVSYGFRGLNLWGLCAGFILDSPLGGLLSPFLMDRLSNPAIFLVPPVVVTLSHKGYYLPAVFSRPSSDLQ
jgi:hypothetical protein